MTSAPLGPATAPTPQGGSPLSRARARVAAAVRDLGPAVPLGALAQLLGGHPNATRQHLEALVAAGLAVTAPLPRAGRGRPATGYTLTGAGRRALGEDPARVAHTELVTLLAEHLADSGVSAEEARALGRSWGAARGGRLVALLDDLGFTPEPDAADPRTLRLRTCPILDAARRHPEIICQVHQGLIEGALGEDASARLLPFAEPGACVVHLDGEEQG